MDRFAELLLQSRRRRCRTVNRAGCRSHRTILVGICRRCCHHARGRRILDLPDRPAAAVAVVCGHSGHQRSIAASGSFSDLDHAFDILVDGAKGTKSTLKSRNVFTELKRRNVYKVAVAYAVVSWLLIQI